MGPWGNTVVAVSKDDAFQHTQPENPLCDLYQAPSHKCDWGFLKSCSEVSMLKQQPVFYGISVKPSYKKHGVGLRGLRAEALL